MAKKMELQVEEWPIEKLKPYEKNPRHNDAHVDKMVGAIKEFGFRIPVVAKSDGLVVDGHLRLKAALKMGLKHVPVALADDLTPAQIRAFRILANQSANWAEWDIDLLRGELAALEDDGFDLALTGFLPDDLTDLFSEKTGKVDADEIPEVRPLVVTKPGDVWQLGSHRIICADSTNPATIGALGNPKIDMLLTDPPYCSGGFQEAGKAAGSVGTRGTEMIANDTLSTRGYMALMKSVVPVFNAGVVYIFTDWRMWINLFDVVESSGYGVRNMIVWDKGTPGMGAGWRMQHELVMCGIRVKSPFNPRKAQGNVIQAQRTGNVLHATEKPVDLLKKIMEVTDLAKTVGDPFAGSGSTLIAAEMAGRACFACELRPNYVDVCIRRWEAFTGGQAILESTGETFGSTEKARTQAGASNGKRKAARA